MMGRIAMKRKAALLLTAVMMSAFVFPAESTAYAEDVVSPNTAAVSTGETTAAPRIVTPMPIGKMISVSIPSDGFACYSFTPMESGCYTIVSYAETCDPQVYLFDGSYDIYGTLEFDKILDKDDDNDDHRDAPDFASNRHNFMLTYKNFVAGKKYYFVISEFRDTNTSFGVRVYKTDENGHCWGQWSVPTPGRAVKARTCVICNKSETQNFTPVLTLTANKLTMKTKQTTSKFKVTDMVEEDSLLSVKSNKPKLLKVSNVSPGGTFKLKAQSKTGTAKLTITLKSGLSKTIKVKIQKAKVRTTSVKVVSRKLTLSAKQKYDLAPVVVPVTSYDKLKCATSNKKVATVSKRGLITAKKKGKATITITSGKKKVKVKVTVK